MLIIGRTCARLSPQMRGEYGSPVSPSTCPCRARFAWVRLVLLGNLAMCGVVAWDVRRRCLGVWGAYQAISNDGTISSVVAKL